jgi:hypothetical protein
MQNTRAEFKKALILGTTPVLGMLLIYSTNLNINMFVWKLLSMDLWDKVRFWIIGTILSNVYVIIIVIIINNNVMNTLT